MSSFGERLKAARERRGLTQAEVQKRIGLGFRSLSRYETGTAAPDPETVTELIRLYDVSADYIMGLSPEMGHATDPSSGTSLAAPHVASAPDAHEMLEGLSGESRKKAEEYIEMLKTLDEVKSGENFLDAKKKA